MRKAELLALPVKKCNVEQVKQKYVLVGHVERLKNKESILVVEAYYSLNTELSYRIFLKRDDYITADFTGREIKWKTGSIYNLLNIYYWYGGKTEQVVDNPKMLKLTEMFLHTKNFKKENSWKLIEKHQENIRKMKLDKKYKKITDQIDELMAKVPEEPKDFRKWIYDSVMADKRYMIYHPEGKKKIGFCTHCKKNMELSNPKAGEVMICPGCGSRVHVEVRISHIWEEKEVYLLQKMCDCLVLRKFVCRRSGKSQENRKWDMEDCVYEIERVLLDNKMEPFDKYNWELFKQRELRWCQSVSLRYYYSHGEGSLYPYNLDVVLENTKIKNFGLKEMAMYEPGFEFDVRRLMENHEEYMRLEYLMKNRLCNIAKDIINGYGHIGCSRYVMSPRKLVLDESATTIAGMLKVDKCDLRFLQDNKANLTGLEYLQERRRNKQKPIPEHMKYIQEMFNHNYDEFEKLMEYAKPGKLIKYLRNTRRIRFNSKQKFIELYKDYLKMAKLLKYDFSNDFVLFPLQLQLRHDQAVQTYNEQKDKKKSLALKKQYKENMQKYYMEYKGLMIVVPKTTYDITKEGQDQHHCVGTYVDKVVEGKTTILFIRSVDKPNESFYTMEVREGKVIQVRGKYNADPTREVAAFVKKFKLQMLGKRKVQVQIAV